MFLESQHSPWAQEFGKPPQHGRGLSQVHQDEPADDGIKLLGEGHLVDIADEESNVRETSCLRTLACKLEYARTGIHAKDAALLAHQLGGQQAHISRATAQVKYVHPCSQARVREHPPRKRIEELALHQ
jgi:hypothetical protein